MRPVWNDLWRKITLKRHKSELRALRFARRLGALAIFPISLTIAFWWFALIIPILVLVIPATEMINSGSLTVKVLGWAVFAPSSVFALIVVVIAAPWFFRWYFIAFELMFGRTGMADRKEAELITAINVSTAANT